MKKLLIKKTKKKNGKFPGTGSPPWLGPLSRYNALPTELRGTCHKGRVNFKTIWYKRSTYCMDQVHKHSEEEVFCLWGCGKLSSHGQEILSSPHQDLKPREDCSYDRLLYPLRPKTWKRIRWENWKVWYLLFINAKSSLMLPLDPLK